VLSTNVLSASAHMGALLAELNQICFIGEETSGINCNAKRLMGEAAGHATQLRQFCTAGLSAELYNQWTERICSEIVSWKC
jgi:hypothetical protein